LKILIIGGGAREHAIAWKLSQSPKVTQLFTAPGNAGTASLGQNLDIGAGDIDSLLKAAKDNTIDLTIVGPEAPLADGIVDKFQSSGLAIFGPTKSAARIESSKVFARELMEANGIPCARGRSFSSYTEAKEYLKLQMAPIVIKADGLAAGKGVFVADSIFHALKALDKIMLEKAFGDAGNKVIIEECLMGREMSFFVFCDGEYIAPMVPACDYKRIFDDDKGPNTGGMGSYTPPSFYTPDLSKEIMETIIEPIVKALSDKGITYKGVLYAGLMITAAGPRVLEFNVRFGDPETQVVLPLLNSDLIDIISGVVNGNLNDLKIDWQDEACVGVVMASGGYPGSHRKGLPIIGLNKLDSDVTVFQAGTGINPDTGQVITSGGRVLTVVARGKDLKQARNRVYSNIPNIFFEGCHYRRDIALFKES